MNIEVGTESAYPLGSSLTLEGPQNLLWRWMGMEPLCPPWHVGLIVLGAAPLPQGPPLFDGDLACELSFSLKP
jgi:hypothetical protein